DGDERLLWTGQPIPARVMRAAMPIFFFAIPWTAFACFWEFMALAGVLGNFEKIPSGIALVMAIVFPLFGLPFIVIGVWLLGKPFSIRKKAGRTLFAITTRRALIFAQGAKQELRSFPLAGLDEKMTFTEEADGSGSLLFTRARSQEDGANSDPFTRGFDYIPRIREAESALRRAIAMGRGEGEKAGAPHAS
ncbi:MAG: hypothetical protein PHW63_03625, partial [Alphaproteobacteria bacterium]|nr:hypothetical protein [Alphaproteobacteria bacterium]